MATIPSVSFGSLEVTVAIGDRWSQNAYALVDRDTKEAIIIDPGTGTARHLIEAIEGTRLCGVLCTHGHYDHLGDAAELLRRTGAVCRVHERDLPLARQAPTYALAFERRALALPEKIESFGDKDRFLIGDHVLGVMPCPGHTPGSVAFRVGSLLFSGDTILRLKIGRTDLPGGDVTTLEGSVAVLLDQLEGEVQILAGHGHPWNVDEARRWWRSRAAVNR